VKVTLRTFGGLAPALRPPPREVDGASLDAAGAARLERLAARVGHESTEPRAPDERRYELAIDHQGECRTVRCGDSTMSDAFAAMVAFVHAHGR
jgi:hypothetical protein